MEILILGSFAPSALAFSRSIYDIQWDASRRPSANSMAAPIVTSRTIRPCMHAQHEAWRGTHF